MNKSKLPLQKTHISSAFSAPLRENRMLNLRQRQCGSLDAAKRL